PEQDAPDREGLRARLAAPRAARAGVRQSDLRLDPGDHLLRPLRVKGVVVRLQPADDVPPFGDGLLVPAERFEGERAHVPGAEVFWVTLLERLPYRQRLLPAACGVEQFGFE